MPALPVQRGVGAEPSPEAIHDAVADGARGTGSEHGPGPGARSGPGGGGRGNLPPALRASIEELSGLDLSDVVVHYNSPEPAALGAFAFARGLEIFLGPGQEHRLSHEVWHVVQQMLGRAPAQAQLQGMGVNADAALEREADEMGGRADELGAAGAAGGPRERPLARRAAPAGVAQLAAPGSIAHVANSCFVAALINVFTVTPSLKNLASPQANNQALPAPAAELRDLLWRAINTVDATQPVPAAWVRNLMVSLVGNQVLQHADQSEDVNTVITRVVTALTNGNAAAGQANGMDAHALVPWQHGTTVEQAFAAQNLVVPPNAVTFNRTAALAAPSAAPPQWTYQIPEGPQITYRLTSIVQRNIQDYVDAQGHRAEHFISFVERSGAGNQWWRSDDVGPSVTAVPDPRNVGGGGGGGQQVDRSAPSTNAQTAPSGPNPSALKSSDPNPSASKSSDPNPSVPNPSGTMPSGTMPSGTMPSGLVASRLASLRRAIDPDDSDSDSEEPTRAPAIASQSVPVVTATDADAVRGADRRPDASTSTPATKSPDEATPSKTSAPQALPRLDLGSGGTPAPSQEQGAAQPPPAPAGFDAMTGGLTYVYQRADEPEAVGQNDQRVGNGNVDQEAFTERYYVSIADHYIAQLPPMPAPQASSSGGSPQAAPSNSSQARHAITARLIRLMSVSPAVYARVARDRALFDSMYVSIKEPRFDPRFRFGGGTEVDQRKKSQRIHDITDQLEYLLFRLGAGPQGLANNKAFNQKAGTEVPFVMNQQTAQATQANTLAKLIAHYAGEDVRMPVYSHRVGPMLGRLTEAHSTMTPESYHAQAAQSLNAVLTSTDAIGSSIRVTEANAGPGAYVATDSDNFYGPHGVAFDPRDLHPLPLSTRSTDNARKHSAERTAADGHQFRALGTPIPFAEDGQPRVADIFVGTNEQQRKDLPTTLEPHKFNPGVLPITVESMLRDVFREHLGLPAQPTQSHQDADHDQPKTNEEVYLMRELILELEGLYEPHAWAELWQTSAQQTMMTSLLQAFTAFRNTANETDSKSQGSGSTKDKQGSKDDDEWDS